MKAETSKQAMQPDSTIITTQSSTDLTVIPDECVDYIFVDPPFGANIMYSESNFIWEAWLKIYTNQGSEAIINRTQKKDFQSTKD